MRRIPIVLFVLALGGGVARAGGSDDLKREIKTQQSATGDLEALDSQKAVADEIALYRTWLDEAWTRVSKGENGRAREVLDRCVAQASLIRQKITTAKAKSDADAHEKALHEAQERVKKTKKALEDAQIKKKAMEMNAK